MKHALFLLPLALLAGCANPGQSYVQQHPELTAEQRKVMAAGRLKNGDAVAGLTREQMRLVMGRDPDQFTKIGDEDAWVWMRVKVLGFGPGLAQPVDEAGTGRRDETLRGVPDAGPATTGQERTTVYFQANRATRVVVGDGEQ